MKLRDYVFAQIDHRETHPIPYSIRFSDELCEKLDIFYGTEAWKQKLKPYILKVSSIDYKSMEPVEGKLFKDAFGTLWHREYQVPHMVAPALKQPDFKGWRFPEASFLVKEKLREAAIKECERNNDSFRIAGFGWGLFEQSWVIRGFENVLTDMVLEQDFYEELLDRIVKFQLALIKELTGLPIDGIYFSDDWGDQRGVIMGPGLWRKLLKPRLAKLYEAVHHSGKIVLGHCCGNISEIIPDLIEIGHDVLESVQPEAMNVFELKSKWGKDITYWGALGTQSIIPFGTPQTIREHIQRLRKEMGAGGGYILAPSKPLQPETPVENAVAVMDAFENE